MGKLKNCRKCGAIPELVDGRTKWFARCKCPAGDNVVYGQSVSFLDHINIDDDDLTDRVMSIVFDSVPWDELRQSAIDAWNTRAPQSEWISVDDRLPEYNKPFLVIDTFGYMFVCQYSSIGWLPSIDGDHPNFCSDTITHWQPLPEPPKGE